jgi:hypothetical protein
MGNLLFWLGIGAAQKGAGSKPMQRRHWVVSFVVGILIAVLIAVGMFFLLVSNEAALKARRWPPFLLTGWSLVKAPTRIY